MDKKRVNRETANEKPAHKKGYEKRLANKLAKFTLEKKASNVVLMDLRKLTSMTDFFVVCSADSDTQVKAIVDHIKDQMKKQNIKVWHTEGYEKLRWVLMDFVDVIVHVFLKDVRDFYNLENLWGDAKAELVQDKIKPKKKTEAEEE